MDGEQVATKKAPQNARMSPMNFQQQRAIAGQRPGSRERQGLVNSSLPNQNAVTNLGKFINRPQSATQKNKTPDSLNSGIRYLL